MKRRLSIFFEGSVQGVGFRFTTEQLARKFSVTGFVKNLPDGRVQVVAEGEEDPLKQFLQAISGSHLGTGIRGREVTWAEAEETFRHFQISY